MSRLVDADVLREHIEDHVASVSVCCTSQEAYGRTRMKMLALRDVDEAPTIDAIPVEWLKRQHLQYMQCNDRLMCDAYAVVLGEWIGQQKEQEAR